MNPLESEIGRDPSPPDRNASGDTSAGPVAIPIGQLAREAGVSTRTVRYYEEIGLLRAARRFAGGRRVFGRDAIERLRFISRLKRLGFSLEEINELNDVFEMQRSTRAMLAVLDGKLEQHLGSLETQMRDLIHLRDELSSYRDHVRSRLAPPAASSRQEQAAQER